MTTPDNPVIAALEKAIEHLRYEDYNDAISSCSEALPLAHELVAKAEALEWLVKILVKEDIDNGNDDEPLRWVKKQVDCPPLIKEMIEKEN